MCTVEACVFDRLRFVANVARPRMCRNSSVKENLVLRYRTVYCNCVSPVLLQHPFSLFWPLSFSPDDKQLTSVGEDGNIFIWNVFS